MLLHILHVSDLHARPERRADIQIVLKALTERLVDILSKSTWGIDLVCFTGDLANKGTDNEYEFAEEVFLNPLLQLLRLDRNGMFLVPGNHDVQRVLSGPELDIENQLLLTLSSRDAVNDLLDNPTQRVRAFGRLRAYKGFASRYLSGLALSEDPTYACVRKLQLPDSDVAVASLNSAWRCNSDGDFKRLLIGERQVDSAGARTQQAGLRISLVHHPFAWLCDFDERDCGRRMLAESDLILSGHVHDPLPTVIETPLGRCLVSSAGALFDGRTFNGFSIIEIDTDSFDGTVLLFRYYDDRRAFDKDLLIVEDGVFRFHLARCMTGAPSVQAPRTPRLDRISIILDDAMRRERVVAAFKGLRHRRGGLWLLGIALGLVAHGPPRDGTGQLEPQRLIDLSASDAAVAMLMRHLIDMGHALRETSEDVCSVTSRLMQLTKFADQLWPADPQQELFSQFDRVVEALVEADSSDQDVLPAKLLTIDELLDEKRYELALKQLRSLNTYHPLVRAKLVEALHTTGQHSEVVAIVTSAPPGTLGQMEIEHCVWSYCEIGKFASAVEWLRHHTRFHTISARVFRRAVSERFPDVAGAIDDPRGDS